jgi:hypothetical protein
MNTDTPRERPKCMATDCGREATLTLHLKLFIAEFPHPADAYLSIAVCDQHVMPGVQTHQFIMLNWEKIVFGFESSNLPKPVRAEWEWVPWENAIAFWEQQEKSKTKRIYTN